MLTEDQEQLVLNEIRRHYGERALPYYLADLGQFFRSKELVPPPGTRFKDFLSEKFQDRLVVVQDPTVPARIAIALPDNREQVRQQLAGRFPFTPGRPPIEVNRLPFSLIAAFYQKPGSGNHVYYRTVRPCRYAIGPAAPDDSYVEVDEQFRQSIPTGMYVHALSNEVKQEIYRCIGEWVEAKGIDLETIYVYEKGTTSSSSINRRMPVSNALLRWTRKTGQLVKWESCS